MTKSNGQGFIKLLHTRNGKLLGATIVGGRASEIIHEWILAINQGLAIGDLAESIHLYPTYSMSNLQISSHIRVSQILSETPGRIIRGLTRWIR